MNIQRIAAINFRGYKQIDVTFKKGINYLLGDNGVGKTNLLEAIYYLANLESFRTNDDRNLINEFKGQFRLETKVNDISHKVIVASGNKEIYVDGIQIKKYREYIGKINVIEFIPEQVYLFKDSPKERRKFIDKEISKVDKRYLEDLLIYNKLLKQRNELLKASDNYKEKLFDVIDSKLASLQESIIFKRNEFLKKLEEHLKEYKEEFKINLQYICFSKDYSKENILKMYKDTYEKDKEKLITSIGIHKDDFVMKINDIDIANYSSQGEQRYCVLLLKLSLAKLVKEITKDNPIIILDDVFSELDSVRKQKVYDILKEYEQVFISGCVKEDLDMNIYSVLNNKEIKEDIYE